MPGRHNLPCLPRRVHALRLWECRGRCHQPGSGSEPRRCEGGRLEWATVTGLPAPVWGQKGKGLMAPMKLWEAGWGFILGTREVVWLKSRLGGKKKVLWFFFFFTIPLAFLQLSDGEQECREMSVALPWEFSTSEAVPVASELAVGSTATVLPGPAMTSWFLKTAWLRSNLHFMSDIHVKSIAQGFWSQAASRLPRPKGALWWPLLTCQPHGMAPWGQVSPFLCSCSFASAPSWGSLEFYFLESSTIWFPSPRWCEWFPSGQSFPNRYRHTRWDSPGEKPRSNGSRVCGWEHRLCGQTGSLRRW